MLRVPKMANLSALGTGPLCIFSSVSLKKKKSFALVIPEFFFQKYALFPKSAQKLLL